MDYYDNSKFNIRDCVLTPKCEYYLPCGRCTLTSDLKLCTFIFGEQEKPKHD